MKVISLFHVLIATLISNSKPGNFKMKMSRLLNYSARIAV